MRLAVVLAVVLLAACASEKLAPAPPVGVDLSGHWKLNEADSDDPQRLLQSQLAAATASAGPGGATGSSGAGGQARGRGGPAGPYGPVIPSVTALDEGLRWPGRDLAITQSGGLVTFTTGGRSRDCRPAATAEQHHRPSTADDSPRARDAPSRGRGDVPPPRCGWDDRTLVVQSGDPEEDNPPFEQRFSLSSDGERLVELVIFKGGRSNGFAASREWDRVPAGTQK